MPTAQLSIQANTVNGKIYVMGGYINDANASELNQVYDPKSNSWSTRTAMPTGQYDYTSAVIGNKIYIFSTNLTQIYDTYYDSWHIGAPAPLPIIMGNAITTIGADGLKRIYVFAANTMPWLNSTRKELTTQCYNPETDSWTTGTSVPTCRYHAAVANINESIYVIGGFTTPFTRGQVSYVDCTANEQYTPFVFASPTVSVQSSTYNFSLFIWIFLLLLGIIVGSIVLIVYLKKK
jgi:N-acetylneuraminic acid mutarotase